jgi:hypothetical protein
MPDTPIKRYFAVITEDDDKDGEFVRYADYRARLDALTAAVRSGAWKDGYGVEVVELAAVLAILNGEPE